MAEASSSKSEGTMSDEIKPGDLARMVQEDKKEELVKYFTSGDRNTREWNKEMQECVMAAIINDKPDILKCLVDAGSNLFQPYRDESTGRYEPPLYAAFRSGVKSIVDILVKCYNDNHHYHHHLRERGGGIGLLVAAFESTDADLVAKAWSMVQELNDELIERDEWNPILDLVRLHRSLFLSVHNCAYLIEEILCFIIDKGFDVNCIDENSRTPLIIACKDWFEEGVRCLLDKGVDVNCADDKGRTPLIIACEHEWEVGVRCLLDKGVDANCVDDIGRTPLTIACNHRWEVGVRCLLDKDVDVNCADNAGRTPLIIACENRWEVFVKYLLDSGVDVNVRDHRGRTPLIIACEREFEPVVRCLTDKGASVNCTCDSNCTPLMIACERGNESVVRFLLANGADVNGKNDYGRTPLMIACTSKSEPVVRCLLDNGADVNSIDGKGFTPLMVACQWGWEPVVRCLVDKGADVTCTDVENCTPLMKAIEKNSGEAVLWLIQHMLLNGIRDTDATMIHALRFLLSWTRFMRCDAVVDQHRDERRDFRGKLDSIITDYALAGIDLNFREHNGHTLLMIIDFKGFNDFGDLLIENGADVNVVAGDGYSVLWKIIYYCHSHDDPNWLYALQKLLAQNIDMRISKHQYGGKTPLQHAFGHGGHEVCNLLLDADCSVYKMAEYLHSTQYMQLTEPMQEVQDRILGICDSAYSLQAQARLAVLAAIGQGDLRVKLHRIHASRLLPTRLVKYLGKAIDFDVDAK